jgi:hypothetical protein
MKELAARVARTDVRLASGRGTTDFRNRDSVAGTAL